MELKQDRKGVLFTMKSALEAYLDKGIKEVIVQFPIFKSGLK
jgi:hypothetical protein